MRKVKSCKKLSFDLLFTLVSIDFSVYLADSVNKMQRLVVISKDNLELILVEHSLTLVVAECFQVNSFNILY